MLDQQFFGDNKYQSFLTSNFISFHAVAGNEIYSQLMDKYSVFATPTVLILKPDGTEIDRVVGFSPPADKWKAEYFDNAYKGENTLFNLTKRYERNPSDLNVNSKLMQKLERQYNYKGAAKYAGNILNHSEDARAISMKYRGGDIEVSAYEHAKFILAAVDPEKSYEFLKEFRNSELSQRVTDNFSRMYYDDDMRDKTLKVFDKMYKLQPDNAGLLSGYLHYSVNKDLNAEKSLKLAGKFFKNNSDKMISGFVNSYTVLMLKSGMENRVDDVIKTFLKHNEDQTYFYRNIAQTLVDNGAYDLGFTYYEKYAEVVPEDKYGLYSIGRAAAISGLHLDKGIKALNEYMKSEPEGGNPGFDAVYWRLGLIYEHKNDIGKAINCFEESLKLNPEYQASLAALKRLKEKR